MPTQVLDNVVRKYDVTAIQLADALFDEKIKLYNALEGASVLYCDDNHLSVTGAIKVSGSVAGKAFGSLN